MLRSRLLEVSLNLSCDVPYIQSSTQAHFDFEASHDRKSSSRSSSLFLTPQTSLPFPPHQTRQSSTTESNNNTKPQGQDTRPQNLPPRTPLPPVGAVPPSSQRGLRSPPCFRTAGPASGQRLRGVGRERGGEVAAVCFGHCQAQLLVLALEGRDVLAPVSVRPCCKFTHLIMQRGSTGLTMALPYCLHKLTDTRQASPSSPATLGLVFPVSSTPSHGFSTLRPNKQSRHLTHTTNMGPRLRSSP
jgi:hypothetical protein